MQFIGAFFVILLALAGWAILWRLVKDPKTPFVLDGRAPLHRLDPEDALNHVRAFFNAEEFVTVDDISNLLAVDEEEAEVYLEYLVDEDEIERYERSGIAVYARTPSY